MKEKIKQFAKEKGWWIIGTGIVTFTLTVIAPWVAFAVLLVISIGQFVASTKPVKK